MWFYWYKVTYSNDFGDFTDEGLVTAENYEEVASVISRCYGDDSILDLNIKITDNEEVFIINSKNLESSSMNLMIEGISEEIERRIKEREGKEV